MEANPQGNPTEAALDRAATAAGDHATNASGSRPSDTTRPGAEAVANGNGDGGAAPRMLGAADAGELARLWSDVFADYPLNLAFLGTGAQAIQRVIYKDTVRLVMETQSSQGVCLGHREAGQWVAAAMGYDVHWTPRISDTLATLAKWWIALGWVDVMKVARWSWSLNAFEDRSASPPQTWTIHVLGCRPEFQHRGYGSKLLTSLEDAGRSRGFQWCQLETVAGSMAHGFYERRGYAAVVTLRLAGVHVVRLRKPLVLTAPPA